MKLNYRRFATIILIIGMLCPIFGLSQAQSGSFSISAGSTYPIVFSVCSQGDVISWDWETTGGSLNFWVESSSGTMYRYTPNAVSSSGSFELPFGGSWYLKWENVNSFSSAYLIFDVSIATPSTGGTDSGSDDFSFDWFPIILLLIIVIVVIVVIARVASTASHRSQTPRVMPPPPPPLVQQPPPPRYCQSCGRAIPGDSVLCPYCGSNR